MFGYNYKYQMHSSKNIIKLAPTKGTILKASLPGILFSVGAYAMLASMAKEPKLVHYDDTIDYENPDNK